MDLQTNGKALPGTNREELSENQNFIIAGGKSKGFDVFNNIENPQKIQCQKCNPTISKPHAAVELCANCEAEQLQTATAFYDNFRRHRKVVKLDCFCFACSTAKSLAMMSKLLPICRGCAGELKTKGATAQNNFIARAVNNFHRRLKGAIV